VVVARFFSSNTGGEKSHMVSVAGNFLCRIFNAGVPLLALVANVFAKFNTEITTVFYS
jgi:hypothetical protein